LLLGALRIALAGIFVAPAFWRRIRNGEQFRDRSDLALLVFLAVCNVGNQMLFLVGLKRTSVAHSALIIGIGPIFVLLIAAGIGLERITLRKVAGMTMALAGVAVLVHQASGPRASGSAQTEATLAGDAVTAAACVLFSMFAVYGKKVTESYGTLAVNGFAYVSGAWVPLRARQRRRVEQPGLYGAISVAHLLSDLLSRADQNLGHARVRIHLFRAGDRNPDGHCLPG
jgi:drug/metabolite transporter (DMT)-like permease